MIILILIVLLVWICMRRRRKRFEAYLKKPIQVNIIKSEMDTPPQQQQ